MKFAIESWAPEFGAAGDGGGLSTTDAEIDVAVERAPDDWAPLDPAPQSGGPYDSVLFVDGVQRIDARVWVLRSAGSDQLGVCASWAAGAVRCNGNAEMVAAEIRRGALCAGDDLEAIVTSHGVYEPRPVPPQLGDAAHEALGQARGDLESRVAIEAAGSSDVELVVVDGPLGDRRHIPGAIGYIKAHHVTYLPPPQQAVVSALGPGQRTPLFRIGDRRFRYAWYLRLPGPMTHPSWGVVRCELPGELPLTEAVTIADRATATLPRFATRPHQDSRAPQNLHPIAGLERQLRHRLGDPMLLERALRRAAAVSA
ncbi:MAG TPA: hypothetical protein VGJ86_01610 [Acidimicrobiales bacterium]|jgi:hypothetical protein